MPSARAYGTGMGGVRFKPRAIVDGQAVIAYVDGVAVVIVRVEEWTLEFANRFYAESTRLTGANSHTLVRVDGGVPGAGVRKRMAQLQEDLDRRIPNEDRRVAVITDSVVARGAMTALGWITGEHLSGFPTTDIRAAAEWLTGPDGNAEDLVALYNACSEFPR